MKIAGGAKVDPKNPGRVGEPALDIEVIRGLGAQAAIYEYEAPNERNGRRTREDRETDRGRRPRQDESRCPGAAATTRSIDKTVNRACSTKRESAATACVNTAAASPAGETTAGNRASPGLLSRKPDLDSPSARPGRTPGRRHPAGTGRAGPVAGGRPAGKLDVDAGSGGGISRSTAAYQAGVARGDAGGRRQCPDAAAVADGSTGYKVWFGTQNGPIAIPIAAPPARRCARHRADDQ